MDIKTELHNLKTMVLTESHISDQVKKKIADRINEIQKSVVINYIPCFETFKEDRKEDVDNSAYGHWFDHQRYN
jgi:hypothetical protein